LQESISTILTPSCTLGRSAGPFCRKWYESRKVEAEPVPAVFIWRPHVQGYQDQRLSTNGIDWRAMLLWAVIIVSFCALFQLCTHVLPDRIATIIL
jgi:hypothetical protein